MIESNTNALKLIAGTVGGIFSYVYGSFDSMIIILVVMVTLDYISGVLKACMKKELSSKAGFKGLLKKLMIFILVGMGSLVDRFVPSANGAIRTAVIMFYVANEGISILENGAEMGMPLPKFLKNILLQLRKDSDK